MTTLDALIGKHGMPVFMKIDVEGFEAEALAGLTRPCRRSRSSSPRSSATSPRLPQALRGAGLCPLQCGAGREPADGACRLAGRGGDRPMARRAADGGEFRGCVCDVSLSPLVLMASDRASRPTTSRSTCRTRASRRCAPRRTTSISSSSRPSCAASRSRRCIRTISAPSWSTARPSTCTTARISRPRRSSPRSRSASRSSKRRICS